MIEMISLMLLLDRSFKSTWANMGRLQLFCASLLPSFSNVCQVNNLIFFFALSVQLVQSAANIQLTAPDGFVFSDDCSEGGVVAASGPCRHQDSPCQVSLCPKMLFLEVGRRFPLAFMHFLPGQLCSASAGGRVAEATLAPALLAANTKYAFRIRVTNPPVPPSLNPTWSFTLANEASELFDSFPLWQIQGLFIPTAVPASNVNAQARFVAGDWGSLFSWLPSLVELQSSQSGMAHADIWACFVLEWTVLTRTGQYKVWG